jgi:hypothetical protein
MKKFILTVASAVLFVFSSQAQNMAQLCGTEDWDMIDKRLVNNLRAIDQGILNGDRMTRYIPLNLVILGRLDGSGRLSEVKLLENLCQLNKDYQDQGIIFYIADGKFKYVNDNNAYENQKNAFGIQALEKNRNKNAINIYFSSVVRKDPLKADDGTLLGYFAPANDWLVIRNNQVNNKSGTLSHEVGHYFSLKHTFSGWDSKSFAEQYGNGNWNAIPNWFKVPTTTAPDAFTPIECFNGSNCKTAGDRMCDTPADYNFGFGWSDCNPFTKKLIGPCSKDSIKDVMEENYMGYFLNCAEYKFTQEQKNAIMADYLSNDRLYIRPNYTPSIETVNQHATGLIPGNATAAVKVEFYDFVNFDWNDVAGADSYYLEIAENNNFSANVRSFITESSNLIVRTLAPNKNYFWRVLPFDKEGGTCLNIGTAERMRITTSIFTISSNDKIESLNRWELMPNPVAIGSPLYVDIDVAKSFDAKVSLYNTVGQEVKTLGIKEFQEGQTRLSFDTSDLTMGVYFVRFQTGNSTETKRVMIQN